MGQPNKRATRARKCKCKCHIKEKAQIVKKGQQIGKNDTLPKAPTRLAPDVGANFRIKIRRKNGN